MEKECQNVHDELVKHFTKAMGHTFSDIIQKFEKRLEEKFQQFVQRLDTTIYVYENIPNKCGEIFETSRLI